MPLLVSDLHGKSDAERVSLKSKEIVRVCKKGKRKKGDIEIDIIDIEEIEGGVQVMARAWKDGKQLGFGKDGTVDIERFRIFNPPVLVEDADGQIERLIVEEEKTATIRLREDPKSALLESLTDIVRLVGRDGSRIESGKVGRTTSTFYPAAGATAPVDGVVQANDYSTSFATTHDAASASYAYDASAASTIYYHKSSGGKYFISRGIINFDTGATLSGQTISSGTVSAKTNARDYRTNADSFGIYASDVITANQIVVADYDYNRWGTTLLSSSVAFTSIATAGNWTDFTLNASGLAAISKTGGVYTEFGIRAVGDASNTHNISANNSGIIWTLYFADETGTTSDPKLVVVHSDATNPSVSTLSPADNATGVSPTANLVITFDEAVAVGTGNITIKKTSDNSTIETIAVGSGQVTGGGTATITINPSVTLADLTEYYVLIDATGFDDLAGNSYAGIASTTAWSFTTADTTGPTASTLSPLDNAVDVAVDATLSVVFNENIAAGTGNVTIKKTSDDSTVVAFDVTADVTINAATLSFTPATPLDNNTEYYVLIDATAIDDTLGNSYAGIASTTAWSFTTIAEESGGGVDANNDGDGVELLLLM